MNTASGLALPIPSDQFTTTSSIHGLAVRMADLSARSKTRQTDRSRDKTRKGMDRSWSSPSLDEALAHQSVKVGVKVRVDFEELQKLFDGVDLGVVLALAVHL